MPFFFDYRLYPYALLFTYRTGYDVYNSVIRWLHAGHCQSTNVPCVSTVLLFYVTVNYVLFQVNK